MKGFRPPLSHTWKVTVTPVFIGTCTHQHFHAQNCNSENYKVMLYRGFGGKPVQNSKSAAQFLVYFCFKNHHKLKAKGRIRPNKNASCCHPQESLRSCSRNRLFLPSFGKIMSLGYGPPCASYFFFVDLLLPSGLQFTKDILWPART